MLKKLFIILIIFTTGALFNACEDSLGLDPNVLATEIEDVGDNNGNNDTIPESTTFEPRTIYPKWVVEWYLFGFEKQMPLENFTYRFTKNKIKIDTAGGNVKVKLDFIYVNGADYNNYLGEEHLKPEFINQRIELTTDFLVLKVDTAYIFKESPKVKSFVAVPQEGNRIIELPNDEYIFTVMLKTNARGEIICLLELFRTEIQRDYPDGIIPYIGFTTQLEIVI